MTYQQLDLIADSYVPLLLLITLAVLVRRSIVEGFKAVVPQTGIIVISVVFIYSLMFVDNTFQIWPSLGLDYSTHTALALVFVVMLSFISRTILMLSGASMFAYCALMIYQEYHTILDIITTAIPILPVLIWFNIRLIRELLIRREHHAQ